jgi:phage-related minor tail protein
MTDERKVQLGVEVDASGAKKGFDQVKRDAKEMAQSVAQSGNEAGRAIDGMGTAANSAAAAADKLSTAQSRFVESVKRQSVQLTEGKAAYLELKAAQLGVSDSTAAYIDKIRAAERGQTDLGMSAKATAAALRGVPAQFTDIVTALASGQRPITVLLQQGGQLKDMFGGVGAAAKAVGGYVVGLINPLTIAAVAVGGLALAWKQGSEEADAYNKALIMTGNIAGVTAGQLQQMAQNVSKSIGTQGEAAAVLAEMAGSSKIAAGNFEQFTRVALQMEQAVGKSVSDTIKDLEALGESPVESAEKLNKQYHFLTAAVYEQIKALQDQGRTEQAAEVAQRAYADAFAQRAQQVHGNLGLLESGWEKVKNAAKSGWDAVLDVGRPDTADEKFKKIQTQISWLESHMASMREQAAQGGLFGLVSDWMAGRDAANIKDLQGQERDLRGAVNRGALNASNAGIDQKLAEMRIEWDKQAEQSLTRQQQLTRELNIAKTDGIALGLSEEDINKRLVNIRKKYADIYNDAIDSQIEALKRQGAVADEVTKRTLMSIQTQRQIGALNEERSIQATAAAELAAIDRRIKALTEELALTKNKQNSLKDQQAIEGQIALTNEQRLTREKQLQDDLLKLEVERTRAGAENLANLYDNVDNQVRSLHQQVLAQEDYNAAIGLSKEQVAALDAEHLRYQATLADENADMADLVDWSGKLGDKYREQAEQLRKLADTKVVGAQKEALVDMWKSVDDAAHDAFVHIFDGGKSVLDRLRDTLKTGLLDLLYQMTVKKWVLNIGASIAGSLGFTSAANAATTLSNAAGVGNAASFFGGMPNTFTNFGDAFAQLTNPVLTAGGFNYGTNFASQQSMMLAQQEAGLLPATNTFASSVGQFAQTAGAFASYASALKSLSNGQYGTAAGTALGQYFGGPIGAFVGNKIGSWLDSQFAGETRGGGQYAYAFGDTVMNNRRGSTMDATPGTVAFLEGPSGGEIASDTVKQAIAGAVGTINSYLKGLGSSATLAAFQAGLETSDKGRGGVFSGGLLSTGATFGESGKGDNYAGTLFEKFSTQSPDAQAAFQNFTEDLKQATIQALQAATDIPKAIADQLKGVDAEKLTEDAANKLLESIGTEIAAVNQFREAVASLPFGALKNLSFDAADALIRFAGGIDNLKTGIATYVQNFYTDQERIDALSDQVQKQLESFGITGVKTKEQFRAVVDSLDLTTESGQKTYAAMIGLSGAFAQVVDYADQAAAASASAAQATADAAQAAADAARSLAEATAQATRDAVQAANDQNLAGVSSAFDVLQSAINAERDRLNKAYEQETQAIRDRTEALKQSAQEQATSASDLVKSLQSVFDDLTGTLGALRPMSYREAQALLDSALAYSKNGGSLSGIAGLQDALRVVQNADESRYATALDLRRDQARTAATVAALRDNAGSQLSVAQMTLDAINQSIAAIDATAAAQIAAIDSAHQEDLARLDSTLANAQAQLDELRGIHSGQQGLEDAIKAFADAVQKAQSPVLPADLIKALYQNILGRPADTGGLNYWSNQIATGAMTSQDVAAQLTAGKPISDAVINAYATIAGKTKDQIDEQGLTYWTSRAYAVGIDKMLDEFKGSVKAVRGYANGGWHEGGWRLVGENGPEVEYTPPARIYSNSQSTQMFSDWSAMVDELRGLRQEVSELKAYGQKTAETSRRTSEILTRVSQDGTSIVTTTA